jgi:hypothetical protein
VECESPPHLICDDPTLKTDGMVIFIESKEGGEEHATVLLQQRIKQDLISRSPP